MCVILTNIKNAPWDVQQHVQISTTIWLQDCAFSCQQRFGQPPDKKRTVLGAKMLQIILQGTQLLSVSCCDTWNSVSWTQTNPKQTRKSHQEKKSCQRIRIVFTVADNRTWPWLTFAWKHVTTWVNGDSAERDGWQYAPWLWFECNIY